MRERVFSTHAVAEMVGTNPSSVVRWIEAGKLKAYKTPGGHRRVRETDLKVFLAQFQIPTPPDLGAPSARRLMIVDGDARRAGATARGLRKALPEAEIATVGDSVEALLHVGASPPDALIVDGTLVDPVNIARALRAHAQTADVSLVVTMPRVDAELERKLRSSGVHAVLTRPVSAEQILEALKLGGNGGAPRG
jgi:excisionase family DNA binding protein